MNVFREIFPLLVMLGVVGILWLLSRKAQHRALAVPTPASDYEVVVTEESLTCLHHRRPAELVLWDEVDEIRLIPTSDGPNLPDLWLLFVGQTRGCSLPIGARGVEALWPMMESRFPGLDLTQDSIQEESREEKILWKKQTGIEGLGPK